MIEDGLNIQFKNIRAKGVMVKQYDIIIHDGKMKFVRSVVDGVASFHDGTAAKMHSKVVYDVLRVSEAELRIDSWMREVE